MFIEKVKKMEVSWSCMVIIFYKVVVKLCFNVFFIIMGRVVSNFNCIISCWFKVVVRVEFLRVGELDVKDFFMLFKVK